MAKDTFYFSHDYNARTDDKVKTLIRKHGMTGYGVFWSIIEDLYNNANALRTDYDGIAYDLRTQSDLVKSIVNDFDLFVVDDTFFGSSSVERLIERNDKSKKASLSAFKRWGKCEGNANALQNECESNAIKERKEKERIEKELKDKEILRCADEFGKFWNIYNKKIGDKSKIFKKWSKLDQSDKDKITETLPLFLTTFSDKKYQPYPETYLNNKRWNDEIQAYTPEIKFIPGQLIKESKSEQNNRIARELIIQIGNNE